MGLIGGPDVGRHGYACLYIRDLRDRFGTSEGLFIYDHRRGDDFNLGEALEKTKEWWHQTRGADGMQIISADIVGKKGTRTFFMLEFVPTYGERLTPMGLEGPEDLVSPNKAIREFAQLWEEAKKKYS